MLFSVYASILLTMANAAVVPLQDIDSEANYTHSRDLHLAKRAPVHIPLLSWSGNAYYSLPVVVGSADPQMNVFLDTGSSSFYLYGEACNSEVCTPRSKFRHSKSKTYKLVTGQPKTVLTYADRSSVEGRWSSDEVAIVGGHKVRTPLLTSTRAKKEPWEHDKLAVSGLMGFGKPAAEAAASSSPFWYNIWCLPVQRKGGQRGKGGKLTLGGYDLDCVLPGTAVGWVSTVGAKEKWIVKLGGLSSGNTHIRGTGGHAEIDTGSTLVWGPSKAVARLYATLFPGVQFTVDNGIYEAPCAVLDAMPQPTLAFRIGSGTFQVKYDDIIHNDKKGGCTGYIGANAGGSGWTIGNPFLRNVYSVFDGDRNRVGLAPINPQGC